MEMETEPRPTPTVHIIPDDSDYCRTQYFITTIQLLETLVDSYFEHHQEHLNYQRLALDLNQHNRTLPPLLQYISSINYQILQTEKACILITIKDCVTNYPKCGS